MTEEKKRKRSTKLQVQLRQKIKDIDQEITALRSRQAGLEKALSLSLGEDS